MRDHQAQLELEEIRLNPGEEWNRQPNQWRFILLQFGNAYWLDPTHPRELGTGELLVVSPAVQGTIRASQLGEAVLQWFGFQPDALLGFLSVVEREWIERKAAATLGPVSSWPAMHAVTREMAALCDAAHKDCRAVERANALVLAVTLLTQCMPLAVGELRHGGAARDRFDELVARMPDVELIQHSSQDLARLCGCTPRHFNRLFRMRFGSPTRVRQSELRLLKARQMLENSNEPLARIASDCGYRTLSLFSSLFRRRFGMSPSEWRERYTR